MTSTIKVDNVVNQSGDNDSGLDLSTNDQVIIKTANTTALAVDASQNVAIGSTDPQGFQLQVNTGVAGNIARFTDGVNANTVIKTSGSVTTFGPDTTNSLAFQTNNTENMRVHNGGKLSINGTTAGSSHVTIYFESASYSALASQMTDNASGAGFLVCRKSDGSTIGQVARNGTSDAVQFLTTSDYRLKENVSYDFDATTQLKQLRPCTFTWINDESNTTHQGFLAHEVQEIVPHAVNGIKDAVDENGNIEAQSIDKTDLVPLLVKTIQELEARITALENAE